MACVAETFNVYAVSLKREQEKNKNSLGIMVLPTRKPSKKNVRWWTHSRYEQFRHLKVISRAE